MHAQAEFEMEFADSEIRQTLWRGDDLHVIFFSRFCDPAGTWRYAGKRVLAGSGAGTPALYACCNHRLVRARAGWQFARAGSIATTPNFRVPSRWEMPLSLELEPAQSGVVVLQAQAMECHLQTGGVFRESLFC